MITKVEGMMWKGWSRSLALADAKFIPFYEHKLACSEGNV